MLSEAKRYIRATIRVLATNLRLGIGKVAHGKKLKFHPATCLALSDEITISRNARVDFGRGLRTRGGCVFNVQEEGHLRFGRGVFLNRGCQINCHYQVSVGEHCEFGPNVLVFDHHHFFKDGELKAKDFQYGAISIGDGCWIGANAIILRGTEIGEHSVIAAGSIVKGKIPPNSLVLQKRDTEIRHVG